MSNQSVSHLSKIYLMRNLYLSTQSFFMFFKTQQKNTRKWVLNDMTVNK